MTTILSLLPNTLVGKYTQKTDREVREKRTFWSEVD